MFSLYISNVKMARMSIRKFVIMASKSLCSCTKPPPTFKKVTHVIFDLDGLLLDSESYKKTVLGILAERYNKKYRDDLYPKWVGKPSLEAMEVIIRELGMEVTPEELFKQYREVAKEYMVNCPLLPGAEQIINHLHKNGIPMAVASNSYLEAFKLKTQKHGVLFSKFHHYTLGENDPEVLNPKPSPDVYLVCAKRFDEKPPPEKCLAIEDSYTGVTAAIAAGMQCVMVPDKRTDPELQKKATLVAKSLSVVPLELFGLPAMK